MTRTGPDWGRLYRDHVSAIAALAGGLSDEQLATSVPGTPAWTVHDVLAHLAGGPADAVAERMDGAPSPAWTARHVGERAGLPVDLLMAELAANTDHVAESVVDSPRPAVVWDIAVHHADLHEALGLGRLPERYWLPVAEALGPMMAPELMAVAPPYEVFRAVFSRRSRAQMASWGADVDVARLEAMCVFGPRDDDQPVPAV
ncbi:hypothetical protein BH11ACT8_BH11ACT8_26370 [soil metagenome]